MAVDRGYGSGKPRSAANSRARQRVAKGQMTKGSKKGTSATLRKIANENPVTGFIGGGILPARIFKAASSFIPKSTKGGLNWGPSITFENPFKGATKAPKVKELDWGPPALFARTSSKKFPEGRGPLNWGPSYTFENPFKRTPKAPKPKKLKW